MSLLRTQQDYGFMNDDNEYGPGFEPETYVVTSGLSGTDMLGDYQALVKRQSVDINVDWEMIASVDGTVVWTEQGTAVPGGPDSAVFAVNLAEYEDNECTGVV